MICMKMRAQLKQLLNQFDKYVDSHIDTALSVTESIKGILASPVADVLTAVIPGTIDDIIRQKLLSALDKAITVLTIADDCKQYTDVPARLNCFIQHLRQLAPGLQDAILQKLASILSRELDGLRLAQNLYDLFTQAKYSAAKSQA